jgi:predicted ArsR family transcriptional regulator
MAYDFLSRLAILEDPVRRRLFEIVRKSVGPVTREQAAREAGIGRTLAAYHLDKLVDEGLLTATYERPAGRTGPGAGRPPKLYQPAKDEFGISVPARDYELIARLLTEAIEADPGAVRPGSLDAVADAYGRELATGARGRKGKDGKKRLLSLLRDRGYEPYEDREGVIRLRNCPFHRLAAEHRDLVCGMNLSMLAALVEELGADDLEASLEPEPGRCCVAIRRAG